ncbi:MAG TPA: hypothetical protein VF159_00545 [Gemmatimonadaceae bacterium]
MKDGELYLDELLGRTVVAGNNRPVGRIEEFHATQRGDYFHVVEFVIGAAGILERLNVGFRTLFGKAGSAKIARADQIDISDPTHPRLTCSLEELRDREV